MLAAATPAAAQRIAVPVMSDDEVRGMLDTGNELEARLDGDLNGDGEIDTIFVERGDDVRRVHVLVAYRSEVDLGHQPAGMLTLDPYPVPGSGASLSIKKGVLVVEDLSGGTSATAATYRYRYDPARETMRLIGLDAKYYSRTNSHGWSSVSWNLLNGDFVRESAELRGSGEDADYGPVTTRRSKRPAKATAMEGYAQRRGADRRRTVTPPGG